MRCRIEMPGLYARGLYQVDPFVVAVYGGVVGPAVDEYLVAATGQESRYLLHVTLDAAVAGGYALLADHGYSHRTIPS